MPPGAQGIGLVHYDPRHLHLHRHHRCHSYHSISFCDRPIPATDVPSMCGKSGRASCRFSATIYLSAAYLVRHPVKSSQACTPLARPFYGAGAMVRSGQVRPARQWRARFRAQAQKTQYVHNCYYLHAAEINK